MGNNLKELLRFFFLEWRGLSFHLLGVFKDLRVDSGQKKNLPIAYVNLECRSKIYLRLLSISIAWDSTDELWPFFTKSIL